MGSIDPRQADNASALGLKNLPPRKLQPGVICFHQHTRMNLHFAVFPAPNIHRSSVTAWHAALAPDTRHLKPAVICFHQHTRMNLHFAVFPAPNTHRSSVTAWHAALAPDTRHLKPAVICFHQHTRMNLHFAVFPAPNTHRSSVTAWHAALAPDTRHLKPAAICFHQHTRMNLHIQSSAVASGQRLEASHSSARRLLTSTDPSPPDMSKANNAYRFDWGHEHLHRAWTR